MDIYSCEVKHGVGPRRQNGKAQSNKTSRVSFHQFNPPLYSVTTPQECFFAQVWALYYYYHFSQSIHLSSYWGLAYQAIGKFYLSFYSSLFNEPKRIWTAGFTTSRKYHFFRKCSCMKWLQLSFGVIQRN